ncbi:MAG: AtpZ/AtpI family protein [Candidatus Fermentithermobacillus carboniphilus]|uniref:AtpZ/AtpI family protein n=1 Tax=Candidatus Fermentithermobacillus carboniphilus TaxID=3085328 RepID=A0AAT9LDJ3_9FIRM|nr:MAG: AtpZ/AtpI family protein [Candidatus Fermentithermobacillus carboniphilus]
MYNRKNGGFLQLAAFVLTLGFSLITSALLGLYLGSILDRQRPHKVLTPIGFLLGLLVGFHRAWLLIKDFMKRG